MKLYVVAVGRLKIGPERDLAERYRDRAAAMARPLGFSGPDVVEVPEGRARRPEDRRVEEGAALRRRLAGTASVVLDERAPSLESVAFATALAEWRDSGRDSVSFTIGGPDGTHADLQASADLLLSFGRLTLPHGLVRVLVFEQIYRALTILAGHPYHRGGEERAGA